MPAYPDATVSLRSLAAEKEADLDEVVRDALSGNLDRYFIRTDNIDKREPDMEQRSAPLVTINMGRDSVEVHESKPEEQSDPAAAEQKPEVTPETPPEEPKVETTPPVETAVVEPNPAPKPEPPAEVKPEPPAEVKPEVPQLPDGYLELARLRNQSRAKRFPPEPTTE